MISEENHATFKQTLVTRLMLAMFFSNMGFLTFNNLSPEEKAKATLLHESVMAKALEIINANDSPELQESFNQLINYFSAVAGQLLNFFYEQDNYPLFNDLFRPKENEKNNKMLNVSLNEHLDMRKKSRRKQMNYYTLESIANVYILLQNQEVKLQANMDEQAN
jgi:hypothetical protein